MDETQAKPGRAEGEQQNLRPLVEAQAEHERMRTELEESRRLLQRIAETSPDVLYIADLDARRTTYINARSTQVFGYTSDELLALGDRFAATLWHPDDLAGLPAHRRKLFGLADGEIYETEHRTLHPDGTYHWLRTHTSVFARTDDGQVRQIIGVIQDVTERKQAEERMAYHAHILEHVHDAIVAADERLVVTAWNRADEQMYGWTDEEALGRDIRDVVRSDFDPEERATGYRVLAETGHYRAEAVHHRKDGSPIHIEGSIVALRDAAERVTGYVYVYRDITERKRAEEALRRAHDDLEATVAERTRELAEANAALRVENAERHRAEAIARLAKEQAERRAREAEEAQSMLKTILEHANEGITMVGGPPDFPIILNSKHANEMLGRAPDTMLNIPAGWHGQVFGIWLNDGVTRPRPEQLPRYRAAHAGEVIENEEWIIERPDGSRFTELCNVAPIRDFAGHIIGAINCWRDISARVQAEKELQEREERFRATFEQAAVGIAHTAPDGTWLRVNQRLCDIVGYTREELLQKAFQDITYPDDLAIDLAQANRLLAGEIATYALEKRYLKKDGSIIWVNLTVSLVRESLSAPSYFIAVVEDIVERKRAEAQLAYQAKLLANVHDAIFATDDQLRLTAWNRAAEKRYGWKAEEVMGRKTQDVVRSEFSTAQRAEALHSLAETGHYYTEAVHHRRDGRPLWIEEDAMILRDEAGRVTGYVTVSRDITVRKQAEQARQRLLQQLITAQEDERGRISRELHDGLGQSLTALHLGLKHVQMQDGCPPDIADEIERLRELALTIDADVDRLTFELRPPQLDNLGLVEALRLLVKVWSATSGIPADMYTRGLDHERIAAMLETTLYRIVQEALTNIFKHARATRVSLIVERRGGEVWAIIEDDGQGFARDVVSDTPDAARKIGLKGMQERTTQAGGRLDIETTPGAGTTIYVRVPTPAVTGQGGSTAHDQST